MMVKCPLSDSPIEVDTGVVGRERGGEPLALLLLLALALALLAEERNCALLPCGPLPLPPVLVLLLLLLAAAAAVLTLAGLTGCAGLLTMIL